MKFQRVLILLILTMFLIMGLILGRHTSKSIHDNSSSLDSIESLADKYFNTSNSYDSALYFYTLILNETEKDNQRKHLSKRVKALHNIGYIYSYFDFDYKQAILFLNRALKLSQKNHLDKEAASIYRDIAGITFTQAQTLSDTVLLYQAFDEYLLAVSMLPSNANEDEKNSILINLLNIANDTTTLNKIYPFLKETNDYKDSTNYLSAYLEFMKKGTESLINKNLDSANYFFEKMYEESLNLPIGERFTLQALSKLSNIAFLQNRPETAINILEKMDSISRLYKLHDVNTDILKVLADYYTLNGQKKLGERYSLDWYRNKDSLMHLRYLDQVEKTKQVIKITELNKELELLSYKRRQEKILFITFIIVAIIIICGVILLLQRNRELHYKNKKIFENIKKLNKNTNLTSNSEFTTYSNTDHSENNEKSESENDKYKGSDLDEETKQEIAEEINRVMNTSNLIFEPGFTVHKLSEITGIKYRHLSQVINETFGRPFYTLLSEIRIREACRRLNYENEEYRNFTIEGIGLSLGFKSRSNFVSNFKHITGMTPNEFRKTSMKN